jgi:hypothetical protein
MAATASAGLFLVATLGLTAPFVALKTPLPYMATPKHKVRRALLSIPEPSRKGSFIDLGSGDGEAVLQAAKVGSFPKAIGFELNWTLWLISQCRRLTWPRSIRARTEFRRTDFFHSKLPDDTSTVMIFGVTPLMRPLSEKLAQECSGGTHVLSYRFRLPTITTARDGTGNLLNAELIYDEEEMRIYRVQGNKR